MNKAIKTQPTKNSSDEIAIKVENVNKTFKLPHEKKNSVKSLFVSMFNRKRTYEKQQALKDISFEIKKGEFFGIVGRNGSGKSTLLKLLAGIYAPDSGNIQVNGKLTPFIELGVGFNPELTGRENVFLNGALLGFSRKEMLAMYNEIVEFAELEKFMDQKLKNYSSGMQVRLAFSIAIRAKSEILLLDEVLAVGDSAFQQKCFDYFERLKREKKTIVFVTHDMNSVKRFCNKGILIEDSKIKIYGSPEEIADQYLLDNIKPALTDSGVNSPESEVLSLTLDLNSKGLLKNKDILNFQIKYKLKSKVDPVLGFAIKKEGISVSEMNTRRMTLENIPNKTHKVAYTTSLSNLNPGQYLIDIAIFDKKNMNLLGYKLGCGNFVIEGNDPSRGGALKANGAWSKEPV